MRTSSMTSSPIRTGGRSPTMAVTQRSAAAVNAAFCRVFNPPRKRTSIVNGDSVAASSRACVWSATAR
jgi:hypothetical protein